MDEDLHSHSWLPALHILGLWAIAVAQPLLDLLGDHAEFFIAHRVTRAELVAVVAGLVLAIPGLLAALVLLAYRQGTRVGGAALTAVLALSAGAVAMLAAKQAGVQTAPVATSLGCAAGVLAAWAYWRFAAARTFATALSLAVLVVPLLFFARPGIRGLLLAPPDAVATDIRLRPGAPPPAPVLLVVLDETPLLSLLNGEGLIDAVLYPNLAQLARDGVWFRNATTVSDDTRWAVPAIVSGRYPRASLNPTQDDYPQTLFTQLAPSHRLQVVEPASELCQLDACKPALPPLGSRLASIGDDLRILYLHRLLTDDLRQRLPVLTSDWARWGARGAAERQRRRSQDAGLRRADRDLDVATTFASAIGGAETRPVFYFLHTLLPHSPWEWLPSGQRNATRTPVLDAAPGSPESDWGIAQLQQRHLMQSELVDAFVGRYVSRLRDAGLYDRSLIIVTADHGIAFRPGMPRRTFSDATAAEIMRVPLVVKFPAGRSTVPGVRESGGQVISDRNAETIDIAPTVLDVLGLEVSWRPDGASLRRPLIEDRPSKTIVFGANGERRTLPAEGPDLAPVLRAKAERFGAGGNRFCVPSPSRFAGLVGRQVAGLQVENGGARISVDALARFVDFQPSDTAAPFDVAGRFLAGRPDSAVAWVAVAVNGTITAVTRTWDAAPLRWLATPPLDAWQVGRNEIAVFVVRGDDAEPVLVRATVVETPQGAPPTDTGNRGS